MILIQGIRLWMGVQDQPHENFLSEGKRTSFLSEGKSISFPFRRKENISEGTEIKINLQIYFLSEGKRLKNKNKILFLSEGIKIK